MEPLLEHPAGEIKRLQRCINDLVSVLALPAIWAGGETSQIITTLLDVLLGMLRLDFVYARLKVPESETPFEMVRVSPSRKPRVRPHVIGEALNHLVGDDPQNWPLVVQNPIGDGEIVVMPSRLGLHGEAGIILAASQRADFPGQTERLLLSVAANQAAIGLEEARLLENQKRVASDLDRRVAQRTAELAAANDELRLQVNLLQHIPVAAWTVKPDGTPDFANQRWLDYTGQTLEYIHAHPEAWLGATHPEDREKAAASFWNGIRSGLGFTTETRFRRVRDGAYRWHLNRAVALRDADGRIIRFVGTSTDIEDLKLAEEKLRQSEVDLRLMTETIPEMLWSATPDGIIDYCNARLRDYTGVPAEEIMGTGWKKLIHPDEVEQTARAWMSCIATGAPYQVEVRTFHAADRTYRWCMTRALPLLGPKGRILKWHGTVVDMHDWKQAQEELRNAQAELAHITRVMTMGQLTASIAHEVNQPLSGIITNASTCLRMLASDPPNVEGARETARRTIRDGNRASEVIARLRALYSKKGASTDPMDLNEAARDVIALSLDELQRNGVILRTEFADSLPLVAGDLVQLQQVILNLLRNASDAMAGVEDRPRRLLVKTEREEGGRVRLTVQDAGCGFDPQTADKLFESFYTTKNDGMGMGLSVCRSIIENHQGRLWAEPNEGPGATFSFSIPCGPQSVNETRGLDALRTHADANTRPLSRNL